MPIFGIDAQPLPASLDVTLNITLQSGGEVKAITIDEEGVAGMFPGATSDSDLVESFVDLIKQSVLMQRVFRERFGDQANTYISERVTEAN